PRVRAGKTSLASRRRLFHRPHASDRRCPAMALVQIPGSQRGDGHTGTPSPFNFATPAPLPVCRCDGVTTVAPSPGRSVGPSLRHPVTPCARNTVGSWDGGIVGPWARHPLSPWDRATVPPWECNTG